MEEIKDLLYTIAEKVLPPVLTSFLVFLMAAPFVTYVYEKRVQMDIKVLQIEHKQQLIELELLNKTRTCKG